jgi:molecular chaperone DnaK
MVHALSDYLEKQGVKVVEASLRRVLGKAALFVREEAHYRQSVIQPGWEALPPPVRLMMRRQFPRWDAFYLALRDQVFDLRGGTVGLKDDAPARVATLLKRFFGERPEGQAAEPTQAGPPLATPVAGSYHPPLAAPVSPRQIAYCRLRIADSKATTAANAPSVSSNPQSAICNPQSVVVGIDLGTTYSLVAHLDAGGRPCTVPNAAGDLLTPSVVLFDEGGTVVGKEALLASALEPEKVAECVKRDMGAKVYRKKINGQFLPPEVISSLILRSLKADAERKLGPVRRAVITVPAYFDETRRRATVDAGRMAGLEVLDIVNEPTAAALAYGRQLGFLEGPGRAAGERPLRVLVFDLGGGTFDVTVVELQGDSFKALATDGDVCLGGKDWDEKLVALAAERFRQRFREDPRDNPVSRQELWLSAEAAKRTLSERARAAIFVNHLGTRLKVDVTREEFEEATADLLGRTRLTAEIVARQAGLTWAEIDRVLLVGGSTRMPMVSRMLEELTGKPPDRSVSADEAVAHGAALFANLLAAPAGGASGPAPFSVTDVNAHSLGILGADPQTGRKRNKVLLPKNTPLPRTMTKVFRTFKPNQRSVAIRVLEGESERPEACSTVGTCTVRDLPPGLPAGAPVEVSYTYEANGRLHVTARLLGHDAGVSTDFVRENSLPDEDLELWGRYVAEELAAGT